MKSFSIHQIRATIVLALVAVFVVGIYVSSSRGLKVSIVESAVGDNVSGYVWSENIGWISLGGDNYGIKADTSNFSTGAQGALSGYAWSEHVGWISFNRTDTGNPPGAPFGTGSGPIAQIDWSTGKMNGWAKALSATSGWDGWIKFSKDSTDSGSEYSTIVNTSTGKISGWAWGSDVVGWIKMDAVTALEITLGKDLESDIAKVALPTMCTPAQVTIDNGWGACVAPLGCNPGDAVTGSRTGVCLAGGTATESCPTTCPSSTCSNGAVNPTACTVNASNNCLNGATNPPTCTTGIGGAGTCNPPNGKCEAGESLLNCPQDCKPKIIEF